MTKKITLNGEAQHTNAVTVAGLVEALKLDPRLIAIEQNRSIVPFSAYESAAVNDDDVIEIVHFVGGG